MAGRCIFPQGGGLRVVDVLDYITESGIQNEIRIFCYLFSLERGGKDVASLRMLQQDIMCLWSTHSLCYEPMFIRISVLTCHQSMKQLAFQLAPVGTLCHSICSKSYI